MSLYVCPGETFIMNSRFSNFWERNCPFGFLLVVFDCVAVALNASLFPFDVLDGR